VLEAGAACYLEKPPTLDPDEFETMAARDAQAPFQTQVGFNFVGDPFRRALSERIGKGEFGPLRRATLAAVWPRDRAYYGRNDWAGRLRVGEQWVQDSPLGNAISHYVQNLLVWASATEVHDVEAALFRGHPIESFDTAFVRARAGETELRIALTHLGLDETFERETLHFERATVRFANWRTATIEHADGRREAIESPYGDQMQVLIENLRHTFRYLRGEESAPITPLATCRPFVALNALAYRNAGGIRDLEATREDAAGRREVAGLSDAVVRFAEEGVWPHLSPCERR
jgi:predicted dehydrogenase